MPVLFFFVILLLLLPLLIPLLLVQRYRVSTARRRGRQWVTTVNLGAVCLSALLFAVVAGVVNIWLPDALRFSAIGAVAGALLGLVGLRLTRWERTTTGMHYTPSRWITLVVVLAVAVRLVYSLARAFRYWAGQTGHASVLEASGAAGSMAVGAAVLAYYLIYWAGIRRTIRRSGSD